MPKDESAAHFYGSVPPGADMAERVGFEPTVGGAYAGFQDRYLQPLGHLSSLAYYSMRWSRAKDEGCFHRYTTERLPPK